MNIYTPEWRERLRIFFDRSGYTNYWAFDFERIWAKYQKDVQNKLDFARLVSHYMQLDKSRVLVIGSQLGTEAIAYALCGASVVGVDLDEDALKLSTELAHKHGTHIEVHCSDGANTGFSDESFDYISCDQVLEHLPRERQPVMLGEIWRLCKPDGLFWIDTPNQLSYKDRHDTGLLFIHWLPRSIKVPLARMLSRSVPIEEPSFGFKQVHMHYYLSYFQIRRILASLGPYEILSLYRGYADMDHYRTERQHQGRAGGTAFEAKVALLRVALRVWNPCWFSSIRLMARKCRN
jgi:2-polyprenyl-3-methyl-5-hydroxy-6-metoxy-1,4-benzoquinol methylase